jgi:hypothetical protein
MHRERSRNGSLRIPPLSVSRSGFLILASALLVPGVAEAQQRSLSAYSEGRRDRPIREGLPEVPGGFTFCRLQYPVARRMQSGLGWSTDYPRADVNLTTRLSELTTTWVSAWRNQDPGTAVVRPTDPDLFRCPFLMASDPGSASFSATDVEALRSYFLKGGFLWVDDFWGQTAWRFWEEQISRVLPEYPIVDVPMDHPLLSVVYEVNEIPQVPHLNFWQRNGGATSELGPESAVVGFRVIQDETGRILVLMSHNTDIADGWERERDDDEYFLLFSPDTYAIGINVLVWTMTH